MRWPWLDTNHFSVSQDTIMASATEMPSTLAMVLVTSTSRSPFSDSETWAGCSCHSESQCACCTPTSDSCRAGPGTMAEARAISVACRPASRALPSVGSGTAKNPHDDPTRARTPTPADCDRATRSRMPSVADRFSVLITIPRASA